MSLYEFFIKTYPIACFFLINIPILAIILPNKWCNTRSISKHFILVLLIVSGLFGIRNDFALSLAFLAVALAVVAFLAYKSREVPSNTKTCSTAKIQQIVGPHRNNDFFNGVK